MIYLLILHKLFNLGIYFYTCCFPCSHLIEALWLNEEDVSLESDDHGFET